MKWTPQKAITSAVDLLGGLRELERVADEVGEVLDLGLLVVVGEDHRVALALHARDRGLEIDGDRVGPGCGEGSVRRRGVTAMSEVTADRPRR